jgi:hypothetical protein
MSAKFGASINYCAQRPESLLIPVAKQPGRRAQKRHEGSAYVLQAAQRWLSYSLLIDSMYTRIWGCPGPLPEDASGIELVNDDNNHDDASVTNDVLPIMEYMLEPPAFDATNTTTTPPVSKHTSGQATYCTLWRPAPGQPLKVYWDTKTHLGLMVQPPAL